MYHPTMRRSPARSRWLAVLVSVATVTAPASALAEDPLARDPLARPGSAGSHDPSATAAYTDAQGLMRSRDFSEAVARLDLAIEMEPKWSAPLELRAEAFGELAERYQPSEAYLSAQASDLERLVVLGPGPAAAGRQQQALVLRRKAKEAREVEQRRRKLVKPAILVITASGALIASGAFMLGFIPSTSADAYGQRRYITAGATMLALGVALAVPAITLGVLAGRQGKRDSALAEFNVRTDRRHTDSPDIAVAPQMVPGGGGMALRLRF